MSDLIKTAIQLLHLSLHLEHTARDECCGVVVAGRRTAPRLVTVLIRGTEAQLQIALPLLSGQRLALAVAQASSVLVALAV